MGAQSPTSMYTRNSPMKRQTCIQWQRSGSCSWGSGCRFVHQAPAPTVAQGNMTSKSVCFQWQLNGNCGWGAACRFTHSGSNGRTAPSMPSATPAAPNKESCRDWSFGRCDRGANCRFSHDGSGGTRRPQERERGRPRSPRRRRSRSPVRRDSRDSRHGSRHSPRRERSREPRQEETNSNSPARNDNIHSSRRPQISTVTPVAYGSPYGYAPAAYPGYAMPPAPPVPSPFMYSAYGTSAAHGYPVPPPIPGRNSAAGSGQGVAQGQEGVSRDFLTAIEKAAVERYKSTQAQPDPASQINQ